MGRALPALAVSLALATAACSFGEPDDLLYLYGRVLDYDGNPVGGQQVVLLRGGSLYDCDGFGRTLYSLGKPFSEFRRGTSNADGTFFFELIRADMNSPGGWPRCFEVVVEAPDQARSRARASTGTRPGNIAIADLPLWADVEIGVSAAPGEVRLALPRSAWKPESLFSAVAYWAAKSGEEYAWIDLEESVRWDAYVLEDYALDAARELADEHVVVQGVAEFANEWTIESSLNTRRLPLPLGELVPASRGAQCSFDGKPIDPCWLTDGALQLRDLHLTLPTPAVLEISFAEPLAPRVIVIRDLQGTMGGGNEMLVEGLVDGRWTHLHTVPWVTSAVSPRPPPWGDSGHFLKLLTDSPRALRGLRFRMVNPNPPEGVTYFGAFSAAREISVFE